MAAPPVVAVTKPVIVLLVSTVICASAVQEPPPLSVVTSLTVNGCGVAVSAAMRMRNGVAPVVTVLFTGMSPQLRLPCSTVTLFPADVTVIVVDAPKAGCAPTFFKVTANAMSSPGLRMPLPFPMDPCRPSSEGEIVFSVTYGSVAMMSERATFMRPFLRTLPFIPATPSTLFSTALLMSAQFIAGRAALIKAQAPATCGQAIDVPLSER